MYSTCHGGADWETEKAAWKNWVEFKGCAAGSPPPPPAVATVTQASDHATSQQSGITAQTHVATVGSAGHPGASYDAQQVSA